jgi:hypothetical protein
MTRDIRAPGTSDRCVHRGLASGPGSLKQGNRKQVFSAKDFASTDTLFPANDGCKWRKGSHFGDGCRRYVIALCSPWLAVRVSIARAAMRARRKVDGSCVPGLKSKPRMPGDNDHSVMLDLLVDGITSMTSEEGVQQAMLYGRHRQRAYSDHSKNGMDELLLKG